MLTLTRIGATRDAWEYLSKNLQEEAIPEADSVLTKDSRLDYYLKDGTPAGRWLGEGSKVLSVAGKTVSNTHMENLFNGGAHPITGEVLGREHSQIVPFTQRVEKRIRELDESLTPDQWRKEADLIVEEERERREKQSVAGFEFVTSPPKSVSAWWALAAPELKTEIQAEYRAAVDELVKKMETDVFKTRIGAAGVAQTGIKGLTVAAFDHWDSRAGDPQLHTHLCVANRVQGADGIWRTIDSRYSLTPQVAELGTYFDTVLMDRLTTRFGVQWQPEQFQKFRKDYPAWLRQQAAAARQEYNSGKITEAEAKQRSADTVQARFDFTAEKLGSINAVKWQIADVPSPLLAEYSRRAKMLNQKADQLIEKYAEKHGRRPSTREIIQIRQQAALETRPKKIVQSLKDLTASWRRRAEPIVGDTFLFSERIAQNGKARSEQTALATFRADDFDSAYITAAADYALTELAETRSSFTETNAKTIIARVTASYRLRSATDREVLTRRVLEQVLEKAVRLTPETLERTITAKWRSETGESKFNPRSKAIYTTSAVWWSEDRLLKAGADQTGPKISEAEAIEFVKTPTVTENRVLSKDQQEAVANILSSGRKIDVLVGAAGAGKTTSLEKLLEAWEKVYGAGSVKGIAPTAKAAAVLQESLGVETENTSKWIYDTSRGVTVNKDGFSYELKPGTLLIIDEASLAGTIALDTLRQQAADAGAKILLVGDWAQLAAVDSGGGFGLLASARSDVAELTELHRFKSGWEKEASKLLRLGKTGALTAYEENGRIHSGLVENILEQAVEAWKEDETKLDAKGRAHKSLLIAATNEMAAQLNQIARKWRIEQHLVDTSVEAELETGTAGVGDRIVTRKNARHLKTRSGRWVKNNDEWVIKEIFDNGDILASDNGDETILPAGYARTSAQLAYATTAHRAQGRTVDTAHAIVDESSSRETLYVAMTRGKIANHAYIVQDIPDTGHTATAAVEKSWRDTLETVLDRKTANMSAHETLAEEVDRLNSVKQLAAEHQTIYSGALAEQYLPILEELNLTSDTKTDNPFLGPVLAAIRRIEAQNDDPLQILEQLKDSQELDTANNKLAVMHYRINGYLEKTGGKQALVAGLLEKANPVDAGETDQALLDRETQIQLRSELIVDKAVQSGEEWVKQIPAGPGETYNDWRKRAVTIACYRDLYSITSDAPLGDSQPQTTIGQKHYQIAAQALTMREQQNTYQPPTSSTGIQTLQTQTRSY